MVLVKHRCWKCCVRHGALKVINYEFCWCLKVVGCVVALFCVKHNPGTFGIPPPNFLVEATLMVGW